MEYVVWGGTALTVLGFFGIIYTMIVVRRAKNAGLSDEELRAQIGRILPINLGALFASTIGLMAVVIGVWLS